MMTPADAKRLVKNRNARENRAKTAIERAEEEELDYVEEELAIYLSDTDFIDYVADEVDVAITEAINADIPVHVGFYFKAPGRLQDDISAEAGHRDVWDKNRVRLMAFDSAASGIDCDPKELSLMLMQATKAYYEEAGWEVGLKWAEDSWQQYEFHWDDDYWGTVNAYTFEIYY